MIFFFGVFKNKFNPKPVLNVKQYIFNFEPNHNKLYHSILDKLKNHSKLSILYLLFVILAKRTTTAQGGIQWFL